jgi:hypothetical protein
MNTLSVTAKINKTGVITQHDRHMLCLQLIKVIMQAPITQGVINVPQLSEQGQGQENTTITQEQCSLSYA